MLASWRWLSAPPGRMGGTHPIINLLLREHNYDPPTIINLSVAGGTCAGAEKGRGGGFIIRLLGLAAPPQRTPTQQIRRHCVATLTFPHFARLRSKIAGWKIIRRHCRTHDVSPVVRRVRALQKSRHQPEKHLIVSIRTSETPVNA